MAVDAGDEAAREAVDREWREEGSMLKVLSLAGSAHQAGPATLVQRAPVCFPPSRTTEPLGSLFRPIAWP